MKTVFAILCTMLLITGPVNAQSQTKSDECDCLKHDLCVKLEQLLSFKDKPEFSINGFETGGPYHKWLLEVQSLCDARSRDKRSSGNHPQ